MPVVEVDPFDLPEWLGTTEVTWTSGGSVHAGHLIAGELTGNGSSLPCDLLGVDQAYPEPVLTEEWRIRSHRAWTHGQVQLLLADQRLTLAVPGTAFTADRAVEVLARFAQSLGAKPERFVVALRP
jgi:hypothetical protein